ncbi:hypothetical protein [Endozoicomonas euniceicola]|uniref:Uncharacterized protein n=1 Tax=Endozoicomonas euniceicola TaxID=1234143 RepID=A0ABY6H2P1_9GAMM|nr:hypothetical protein [Endozoicomonas euniceicola]UYM18394.1 hypothetical protein NX720_10945 [Endozoicomonas euniceicola]
MKVSMTRVRAYFKEHMSLGSIKKKIAQKFGLTVKTKEQVETKIPKGVETEAPLTDPKSVQSRQTKKTKPPAQVNRELARNKKQLQKLFGEMLQNWMSDKPEKAAQDYAKYYNLLKEAMILEEYGEISADDYAQKNRTVMLDFIASLKTKKSLEKVKKDLRHGGKIFRGLSALTYMQNGQKSDGTLWRHSLSESANHALVFVNTFSLDMFKYLLPLKADALQRLIMEETDPERSDQSKQEVEDIQAVLSGLEKLKDR